MIVRSVPTFTLRNILDRVGLASMQLGCCHEGRSRPNFWQRVFAALGDWSSLSALAWRSEILLLDRPERSPSSAEIARRIPRTRGLTNSGRVGMPKYAAAGNAGGRT